MPELGWPDVPDLGWIDAALVSARPQAVAALLRYFRDLDLAEEAYQDACLRALKAWPKNGPPRDPAAWLIMVGRNAAIDVTRRRARQTALPDEDMLSDDGDEEAVAEGYLGLARHAVDLEGADGGVVAAGHWRTPRAWRDACWSSWSRRAWSFWPVWA